MSRNDGQGRRITDDMVQRAKELLPGIPAEVKKNIHRVNSRWYYGRGIRWLWPSGAFVDMYEVTERHPGSVVQVRLHANLGTYCSDRAGTSSLSASAQLRARCDEQRAMADALELLERTFDL